MSIVNLEDLLDDSPQLEECVDSLQLIKQFFDSSDINWGFCRFIKNGKSITPDELNSELKLWIQRNNIDTSVHKNEYIKAAFSAYDTEMYDETLNSIKEHLKFDCTLPDEFSSLKEHSGLSDDDFLILKSWIWNVKQTINGRETQQVPMPLLYSNQQRYGKSTFNQKLYSPVAELALRRDVRSITDTFGNGLWRKLLVVDFDEISSIKNSMVAKFKEWCYADKISMRNPNTATMLQFEKVTNAIASSNVPVKDILQDSTGSRRIWQINLTKPLFDALENVDFIKLWKSVDENAKCPLYINDQIDRITQLQYENQRYCSPVEIWLAEFKLKNINETVKAKELFSFYDSWRRVNNDKRMSMTAFGSEVKKLGIESTRRNTGVVYLFES